MSLLIAVLVVLVILFFPFFDIAADKPYGISTEEAQRTYRHLRLGDENFDVPTTYLYRPSGKFDGEKRWSPPNKRRKKVDVISIQGLMPDMAPYSEENSVEFDRLGLGKKLMATLSPGVQDWTYYLEHFAKKMGPMPESAETPKGFKRFYDPNIDDPTFKNRVSASRALEITDEVFMNFDRPVSGATRIACNLPGSAPSPGCKVVTEYRGAYRLTYWFSRDYLAQWLEIDHAVKTTFDRFIEHSEQKN